MTKKSREAPVEKAPRFEIVKYPSHYPWNRGPRIIRFSIN